VLVVVLASAVAGWAAEQARTPGAQAARAKVPPPSVVTARVTGGTLSQSLQLTGTLRRAQVIAVHGPLSVAGANKLVVTRRTLVAGMQVVAGTILSEVSGRPVVALHGGFGAYRDLTVGDTGSDVSQLQRGLGELYGTPVTGTFDQRTAADLRLLYARIGYPVLTRPVPSSATSVARRPVPLATQPVLPAGEVAYLPTLPAVVAGLPAGLGSDGSETLLSVATGAWTVQAPVNQADDAQLQAVKPQTPMTFGSGPLAGARTKLASLTDLSQSGGNVDPASPVATAIFVVSSVPAGVSPGVGQQVRVQLLSSPPGALLVPASALWTAPDGTVVVEVPQPDGSIDHLPVRVAVTSNGRAAVIATAQLHLGDKVVVAYPDATDGN
jgi:hypothetical protein